VGERPSRQRTEAIKASAADIIYFLDHDSVVSKETLELGIHAILERDDIHAVGPPALTRKDAGLLEKCFGEVMSSVIGSGVTPARHRAVSKIREVRGDDSPYAT